MYHTVLRALRRAGLLVACLHFAATPAWAQLRVTRGDAERAALSAGTRVALARADTAAALARLLSARTLPNPTFSASYNTKGGNNLDSYQYEKKGPLVNLHREAFPNQGVLEGSGLLLRGGQWSSTACSACFDLDTSSITMLRGDVTYYKEGWGGSHQIQTGFLAMPRSIYDKNIQYLLILHHLYTMVLRGQFYQVLRHRM